MAVYDTKVLNGEHLAYLIQLIKAADSDVVSQIPTVVSALTNDSGFQTASDVTSAINTAISGLTTFHFEVVTTLPTTDPDTNAIYLVPKTTTSTGNIYEEWAYVITDSSTDPVTYGWEHLGDTQVDIAALSNTEIKTIWDSVT